MEEEIITFALTILENAIATRKFAVAFKTQLLQIAAAIQTSYGLTPPTS